MESPQTVERTLQQLIDLLEEENIAEELSDSELVAIAEQVKTDYEADDDSMETWKKLTDIGLKLVEPATGARDEPWEEAANFKSPAIQEAAYRFGERASTELLRPKDLVKAEIIGPQKVPAGPPGPDGEPAPVDDKQARVDRVTTYMNYQVNHEIPEWRDEQRSLFYRLPNMGTVFKKTYFDPLKEHTVSELIQYPDFAIDQANNSMEDLGCFTHTVPMTKNEIESMQRMGLWLDIKLPLKNENDDDECSESHDSPNLFLEQQTLYDLDGDGYEEPYIITVHKASNKVVCIKPRYQLSDVLVKDGKKKAVTLDQAYGDLSDEFGAVETAKGEQATGFRELMGQGPEGEPIYEKVSQDRFEIVKITPERNLTAYRFMPSADGTFLGVGYYQLLSALVEAINAITNQLINAGTLANQQSGYLAKGMRKRLGDDRFKPGELKQTNVLPKDLLGSILYHQFKEPSATLMALAQDLRGMIKDVTASVDLGEILGTNTAASTVLMMIEEAQSSTTSLMSEQARSMGKEFQIIYSLNAIYTDPQTYQEVLDEEADYQADFGEGGLDIVPTANPEMASKSQRIQQGQILQENQPQLVEAGANPQVIAQKFLESIGIEDVEAFFPPASEEETQQQQEAQARAIASEEAQTKALLAQASAFEANAENLRASAKVKLDKLPDEIEKLRSEMIKNLEQAESEQSTNQIDLYTAHIKRIDGIQKLVESMGVNSANTAAAAPINPQAAPAIDVGTNNAGGAGSVAPFPGNAAVPA